MSTHVVQQGECFATIANAHGFSTKALYEHPDNADLRKIRPSPSVLHPGDEVVVPERAAREVSVASGAKHRFKVKVAKRELRLILRDHAGKAIAGESYVLETDDERIEGETSGDGELKHLIASARQVTLTLRERVLVLDCGCINPMTDTPDEGTSGACERLRNMGYAVDEGSDALGPSTRVALALFQHDAKLDVTGELDDATRAKLIEAHGC
jgi:N-acetylmuramoyl-L-alanine amidase